MINKAKPKNARSKRILDNRDAKTIENPKTTMFIRGSQTSDVVQKALADLYSIKKPLAINFSKKNEVHPFDDETKVEFMCKKNDSSLFVLGNHSKKRPNNLVFGRTFDYSIFEMFELEIEKFRSIREINGKTIATGTKPMIIFSGEAFNQLEELKSLKNYFLDFFQGERAEAVSLGGLEHVISFIAESDSLIKDAPISLKMRSYVVDFKKSGVKHPRVELENMGPSFDFRIRRIRYALPEVWKHATRIPNELYAKSVKNISHDSIGNKTGRIHLGKQAIDKIQTRKVKGLKKTRAELEGDEFVKSTRPSKKAKN